MKLNRAESQETIIRGALDLATRTGSDRVLVFLNVARGLTRFLKSELTSDKRIVLVVPKGLKLKDSELKDKGVKAIRSWAGNQSRFSRIKYAFLHGVMQNLLEVEHTVICVLGPRGKDHLDTIIIHDVSRSWSEDFPFDPRALTEKRAFHVVMAVVDIALDIGAMGREGKSVGTVFVIGDTENVMNASHQAVFNPFRGYPKRERDMRKPEVVESLKEVAQLDGAIVISDAGIVEAAGRHLDTMGSLAKQYRGLGARHRASLGITRRTATVAVTVSETTGRVTIFDQGRIIASLEPVIGRRLV